MSEYSHSLHKYRHLSEDSQSLHKHRLFSVDSYSLQKHRYLSVDSHMLHKRMAVRLIRFTNKSYHSLTYSTSTTGSLPV